jgi:hypothetical protein
MTDAQLLLLLESLLNELRHTVNTASDIFDEYGAEREKKFVWLDADGNETTITPLAQLSMTIGGKSPNVNSGWVDDPNGRPLVLLPLDGLLDTWKERFGALDSGSKSL